MKYNILSFTILIIVASAFPFFAKAQSANEHKVTSDIITSDINVINNDSTVNSKSCNDTIQVLNTETNTATTDSGNGLKLTAPIPQSGIYSPFSMYGITPFYHSYANWELHEGFNASLGMSVTFSPNKFAPSGVGFGQDAAFMYAVPINSRLSIAGGLYATNMDWGRINYKNIGIAAVAAFKVNDKITLYGYGNKSLIPKRSPMYYPLPNFSPDKFGGMINFKLGESSSISFGVEGIRSDYPYYFY